MPRSARNAASAVLEKCGCRRDCGILRTSAMAVTPCDCSNARNRSAVCVECPMVKIRSAISAGDRAGIEQPRLDDAVRENGLHGASIDLYLSGIFRVRLSCFQFDHRHPLAAVNQAVDGAAHDAFLLDER